MKDHFINVGVAEQNMISTAAGIAKTGLPTFVYSIAPFAYARPFEQIRNDVCLHNLPVTIVGNGGGYGYGVMGATWSFHLAWTLWMIPRDQPDLKDNGTFLSLTLIYLGNLLVLIGLLCLAAPKPLESLRDFGYSWFGTAMTWGDAVLRWLKVFITSFSA